MLTNKEDFVEGPHNITIPAGTASGEDVCIDLDDIIIDDSILESTEDFMFSIAAILPCGDIGPENETLVNITDNDSKLYKKYHVPTYYACVYR